MIEIFTLLMGFYFGRYMKNLNLYFCFFVLLSTLSIGIFVSYMYSYPKECTQVYTEDALESEEDEEDYEEETYK